MRFAPVLAAAVLLLGVGGCSDGSADGADAASPSSEAAVPANGAEGRSVLEGEPPTCEPASAIDRAEPEALLPKGVHLPDGVEYLAVEQDATYATVSARLAGTTPGKLRARYSDELRDAGYEVLREDDEGFEAEVYFAFDDGRQGTLQFVKSTCPPNTVRINVSYLRTTASTTTSP